MKRNRIHSSEVESKYALMVNRKKNQTPTNLLPTPTMDTNNTANMSAHDAGSMDMQGITIDGAEFAL